MIDTNLIIGRLGSGKTSCIKHFIQNKPEHENWAVIVNEFGQIGIDAALLEPESSDKLNITEIAGGCICCASQAQLHVTLTKLIRLYRPDRIIIEATGLGHPAGIIDLLRDKYLLNIININSIISILDLSLFNNFIDSESTRSPILTESFKHQNTLADIVILNKSDLASESAFDAANLYLKSFYPSKSMVLTTTQGQIENKWLSLASELKNKEIPSNKKAEISHSHHETIYFQQIPIKSFFSENDDTYSFGFILPSSTTFKRTELQETFELLLNDKLLNIIRLKAVLNCGRFWYGFNGIDGRFETTESFYRRDNRIEFICSSESVDRLYIQNTLFNCIKL